MSPAGKPVTLAPVPEPPTRYVILVMALLIQTVWASVPTPEVNDRLALPFTVNVDVVLLQPLASLVKVNVVVPAEIPVTRPLLSMVATASLPLVQIPPDAGDRLTVAPTQTDVGPDNVGRALITRLVPLSVTSTPELLLITRILYCVPAVAPDGMVALMVPEFALLASVPIFVGLPKEPVDEESWAV